TSRIPNFPARMFHAVFAAAAPQRCVTPVVFGDKFGVGPCWNRLWLAGCRHFDCMPFAAAVPRVFHLQICVDPLCARKAPSYINWLGRPATSVARFAHNVTARVK